MDWCSVVLCYQDIHGTLQCLHKPSPISCSLISTSRYLSPERAHIQILSRSLSFKSYYQLHRDSTATHLLFACLTAALSYARVFSSIHIHAGHSNILLNPSLINKACKMSQETRLAKPPKPQFWHGSLHFANTKAMPPQAASQKATTSPNSHAKSNRPLLKERTTQNEISR